MSVAKHHGKTTTHHNYLHVVSRLSHKLCRSVHMKDILQSMKTLQQLRVALQSAAQASVEVECNTEAAVAAAACKLANLSVLQY